MTSKIGEIDIIVNVDIFSEGFDCPSLEFVQLARPTRSLVKYLQQVGRGLRKNGDKKCIILDNVGMYNKFGLPNFEHPWQNYFDGNELKNDVINNPLPITECDVVESKRHTDLTEGDDTISLIQEISIEEQAPDNIPICTDSDEQIDGGNDIYIESKSIFSKYKFIEYSDGYGIKNIKTNEKQFLCSSNNRRSIMLKVVKIPDSIKKITIVSSFNRDRKVTLNDRIIGHLYKDGALLYFEFPDKNNTVEITI